MLAPHHGKYAKFEQVGLTPKRVQYTLVFLGAQPVLFDDVWGDRVRVSSHGTRA